MTKSRISQTLFWTLVAATAVLFGFFVAILAGAISIERPAPPPDTGAVVASRTRPAEEPAPTTVEKPVRRTTPTPTPTATPTPTRPPTPLASVVVTAARGDSWILARLGSENGRLLDERVLAQGESATLRGARVWLSLGAAGNVDVTVNGAERELPTGTVTVVLGPT
jgi:hypothetical protein